jgi:hypothetical protein
MLTLTRLENEEEQELASLCDDKYIAAVPLEYNWAGVHSHKCLEMDFAKNN